MTSKGDERLIDHLLKVFDLADFKICAYLSFHPLPNIFPFRGLHEKTVFHPLFIFVFGTTHIHQKYNICHFIEGLTGIDTKL